MATNFSLCKGSYVLNQFPSNVMFGMNGFHVSASGAIQGHHGPLVYIVIIIFYSRLDLEPHVLGFSSLELFDMVVMISLVSSIFTSFCILHNFPRNELAKLTKTTPSLIIKPNPNVICLTSLGCSLIFS